MILWYLWRAGLTRSFDREKALFFFGLTSNPLFLSRRWPLITAIHWLRALVSPSYARAVAAWLLYRVELFDGLQG